MTTEQVKELSDEQIRIKVAELLGWVAWKAGDPFLVGQIFADTKFNGYKRKVTHIYNEGVALNVGESPLYESKRFGVGCEFEPINGWHSPKGEWVLTPPNFPINLNACHEMEKVVRKDHEYTGWYLDALKNILDSHNHQHSCKVYTIFATARQRCEAFILTMDKA